MAVRLFFTGNYKERINSPIITTGNELIKQQIADFSKHLDLEELFISKDREQTVYETFRKIFPEKQQNQ